MELGGPTVGSRKFFCDVLTALHVPDPLSVPWLVHGLNPEFSVLTPFSRSQPLFLE